jgi:hypothetical protein
LATTAIGRPGREQVTGDGGEVFPVAVAFGRERGLVAETL